MDRSGSAGARPREEGTEWALFAMLGDLRAAEAEGGLVPVSGGWAATLASGEALRFTRLYAGSRACRHDLPSIARWDEILAVVKGRGAAITLQTPPVPQPDLARVEALLRRIDGQAEAEVVVNDLGVLRMVRREFPSVRPILGLGLRRQKKDARVPDLPILGAMLPEVIELYASLGVTLFEADRLTDDGSPVPLAMHAPYAFVAAGGICTISGLGRAPDLKFRPDSPCAEPCRYVRAKLEHPGCVAPMLLWKNEFLAPNGVGSDAARRAEIVRIVYDLAIDRERTFLAPGAGGTP